LYRRCGCHIIYSGAKAYIVTFYALNNIWISLENMVLIQSSKKSIKQRANKQLNPLLSPTHGSGPQLDSGLFSLARGKEIAHELTDVLYVQTTFGIQLAQPIWTLLRRR
jgi:hypothetical protein